MEIDSLKKPVGSIYVRAINGAMTASDKLAYNTILSASQTLAGRDGPSADGTYRVPMSVLKSATGLKRERLFESLKRLVSTTVSYDVLGLDHHMVANGVMSLLSQVQVPVDGRDDDDVVWQLPAGLAQYVVQPRFWAALSIPVMRKLSSKYSIALYEMLSPLRGRQDPVLEVDVDNLVGILGAPGSRDFGYVRERAIQPAVDELNKMAGEIGFSVSAEYKKRGRGGKVEAVVFTIDWSAYNLQNLQDGVPVPVREAYKSHFTKTDTPVADVWVAFVFYAQQYGVTVTKKTVVDQFLAYAGIYIKDCRKNAFGHVSAKAFARVRKAHKDRLTGYRDDAILAAWQLALAVLSCDKDSVKARAALELAGCDADEAFDRFVRRQCERRWDILAKVGLPLPDGDNGYGVYLRTPGGDDPDAYLRRIKASTRGYKDEAVAIQSDESAVRMAQECEPTVHVEYNVDGAAPTETAKTATQTLPTPKPIVYDDGEIDALTARLRAEAAASPNRLVGLARQVAYDRGLPLDGPHIQTIMRELQNKKN